MLEQEKIKKRQVGKGTTCVKFKADNNKKYEIKSIGGSAVYARKSKSHYLS